MAKPRPISNLEVARYYLKCEFAHIFPVQAENLYESIEHLRDNQVWRLCEALSIFYRLNAVWWVINNRDFQWTKETVPLDQVVLTGIGDNPLDRLLRSENINRQPVKLKVYLLDYYAKFPDDPEGYSVKPTQKPIRWPQVMLAEARGGLRLIDGSHRFIEQLLRGAKEVEAYVARPSKPVESFRPTGGRGAIWLLDNLAKSAPQKSATVQAVARILAEHSMFKDEFNKPTKKDAAHA